MGEHDLSPSWPSAEVDAVSDELDLDKWIDGTTGLTRRAKIYQRGDLLTEIDRLEAELAVSKEVEKAAGKADRGVSDFGSAGIQAEIDRLTAEVAETALTVHVQDRTDDRRHRIRDEYIRAEKLDPDKPVDAEKVFLRLIADAIVKVETPDGKAKSLLPDGFPMDKLLRLNQRIGDSALFDVIRTYHKVTQEAPTVSAPLSRRNSSGHGGIT